MKYLIIGLIILILILSFTFRDDESKIRSAIEKANYCEIDSDCVDAGGKCPFGCYVYVNKDKVDEISELIGSYDSKCVYGCILCPMAICEDNRCKEICEG